MSQPASMWECGTMWMVMGGLEVAKGRRRRRRRRRRMDEMERMQKVRGREIRRKCGWDLIG
jgi:hypothetical protein